MCWEGDPVILGLPEGWGVGGCPPVSPPHAMLDQMMCQKQCHCDFRSALCLFRLPLLALLKRWTLPCHPSNIGLL